MTSDDSRDKECRQNLGHLIVHPLFCEIIAINRIVLFGVLFRFLLYFEIFGRITNFFPSETDQTTFHFTFNDISKNLSNSNETNEKPNDENEKPKQRPKPKESNKSDSPRSNEQRPQGKLLKLKQLGLPPNALKSSGKLKKPRN